MATPIGTPGGYSAIIDARTEDEFALDHLPGALNWPSLDNEQRITIGTLYKQVNPFEAKKRGAALVAAQAPVWTVFALVAVGMAAYGTASILLVRYTPWEPPLRPAPT